MTVAPALGQPVHADERPGPGTVAEAIGGADRAVTRAAAKGAGVHSFVLELPQGYDTLVGDGGLPLSTSVRRRLGMAHRLATDPASAGDVPMADPPLPPDDPDLPGFRRLLDVRVVTPILARALRSPMAPRVRVRSVRYKAGKNAVVDYDVGTGADWLEAVMYATTAPGKLMAKATRKPDPAGRLREATTATPSPLSFELGVGALLQWLPFDPRLEGLATSGAELSQSLAAAGLEVEEGTEPEILRYSARRRAVLGFGEHVIKLYRDPLDFAAAEQGLRAATGLAGVGTARFEALLPALRATVQRRIPGGTPRLGPADGQPLGALLARLHRASVPAPLPVSDTGDLLAKAANRARFVARLVPSLEADLGSLLAELETRRPRGLPLVPSHGNFHAGQVIETEAGLVMIDVDRLCLSHPAYDLASYASHVAFGRTGDPDELEVVERALAAAVEGYGSPPDALGWFLASCLLRRAAVPFRYFDERWPHAAAALVRSAGRALDR
ncbi:MAG: phosphotransferase [Acidimicrobiia bacterium]